MTIVVDSADISKSLSSCIRAAELFISAFDDLGNSAVEWEPLI